MPLFALAGQLGKDTIQVIGLRIAKREYDAKRDRYEKTQQALEIIEACLCNYGCIRLRSTIPSCSWKFFLSLVAGCRDQQAHRWVQPKSGIAGNTNARYDGSKTALGERIK